ncbi:hypothetical protein SK128_017439 [Halocaridina rubra]|uniref:Uncharacterized protein n=1 Tax=Halocaridina rubra TaxID=373956 RepID=A0AAN9FWF9_HALRR
MTDTSSYGGSNAEAGGIDEAKSVSKGLSSSTASSAKQSISENEKVSHNGDEDPNSTPESQSASHKSENLRKRSADVSSRKSGSGNVNDRSSASAKSTSLSDSGFMTQMHNVSEIIDSGKAAFDNKGKDWSTNINAENIASTLNKTDTFKVLPSPESQDSPKTQTCCII